MNLTADNEWIVEPEREIPATGRGRIVRQREFINLRHRLSSLNLAPLDNPVSSLVRFTTITDEEADLRPNSTRFELIMDDAHMGQQWMSKTSQFILIHDDLQSAIVVRKHGTHLAPMVDVSGTRNLRDDAALFTVDAVELQPGTLFISRPMRSLLYSPPEKRRCRAHAQAPLRDPRPANALLAALRSAAATHA